jgi:DNA-binding response OmpR family regulator
VGTRVLLLDDEAAVGRAVTTATHPVGITVDAVQEVQVFFEAVERKEHDVLIIDWNLRVCEGTEICERLRSQNETRPIALLSGKLDSEHARELALAAGADGYIEKPLNLASLVAEIEALLRTSQTQMRTTKRTVFRCTPFADGRQVTVQLAYDRVKVTVANEVLRLRPKEFELLQALLERPGQVVSNTTDEDISFGARSV